MDRGTGRTTQQMINAPKNAVFVWLNQHLGYPKSLARNIGRDDLEIVPPSFLDFDKWRGRRFSAVILDHAFKYSSYRQLEAYDHIQKFQLTTASTRTVGDSPDLSKSFTPGVNTNPEGDPIPPASR